MTIRKTTSLLAAILVATAGLSQAALTGFTNYGYTGGTTASWDIFYGADYLQNFNFPTGTVGNPSNSASPLSLTAFVPNWATTQATGPVGSDFVSVPGDAQYFYTNAATPVNFTIYGIVTGTELDNLAFQASVAGTLSNVLLNGASGTASSSGGISAWTWSDLNLTTGSSFSLTFQTLAPHTAIDALQIQTDAQVVPEPSTSALTLLGGVGLVLFLKRRRNAMARRA